MTNDDADKPRLPRDGTGVKPGSGMRKRDDASPQTALPDETALSHYILRKAKLRAAPGSGSVVNVATPTGINGIGDAIEPKTLPATPPWKSDRWTEDATTAQQAIHSGQVPSEDQEIVEDYFRKE